MPFIPLLQQPSTRPSEIGRINPGYSNLSIERKFTPVVGTTYIWILTSKAELIIGIEEPWSHSNAFAINNDNQAERSLFEQILNQLRAPAGVPADTWKFGHPTLTANFNKAGEIVEDAAYIGGEFSFNAESNVWIVNNLSGRYGRFAQTTIDPEVEKKFQEQVIRTLYVVIEEFNKVNIFPLLDVSFDLALYDPYCLTIKDLLFHLKESPRLYNALSKNDQLNPKFVKAFTSIHFDHFRFVDEGFFNPDNVAFILENKSELLKRGFYRDFSKELQSHVEIVREYTNNNPCFIQWVERDFFILYPNEAMEILAKTNGYVIYHLMEKFHSDLEFLNFAKSYLTAILDTTFFSELIKYIGPSMLCRQTSELFDQILSWFGIKTIIAKNESSIALFMVLKRAKEMGMDLTELTVKELTAEKLDKQFDIEKILNLFPENKRYEFAAEVISVKLGLFHLRKWITSLRFYQLADLLAKKPSNFASLLEIMDKNIIVRFMRFLVDCQYPKTAFKLDSLFDLYFHSNIVIKARNGSKIQGVTITPINAALIVLNDQELIILLEEFGNGIVFNMSSALNFLSVITLSLMDDKKKDLLIFFMLDRIVETTKNTYQFEKIMNALPEAHKSNYAARMHAKHFPNEQENDQQAIAFRPGQ